LAAVATDFMALSTSGQAHDYLKVPALKSTRVALDLTGKALAQRGWTME
jgi:hypothetical protein